ncbi:PEP/pyruvate-binding domain-containing protein [Halosolutus amylolyticus]|uniref:PEP/pyruvate-binding domain-containing protein n=1 Tax=Halosolutus amylolyticus TaxID=2932267 RepID=A0ABD5PLX7_9EURY|nr:PEP/pyruvate-binding domain-containing protein [Halosolutus amylolyticus]
METLEPKHLVLPLTGAATADATLTGGKGANLARLIDAGLPVPDGFCVTTAVYDRLVADAEIEALIADLEDVDPTATGRQRALAGELRDRLRERPLPADVREAIASAVDDDAVYVARSSATAEDLPSASFAGQHETELELEGLEAVLDAISACMASLFTDRAVAYRATNNVPHGDVSMAVVVQRMVDADASGVLFTADPTSGRRTVASIDAAAGLGESVVSGTVTADNVRVDRESGEILEYRVGDRDESNDGRSGDSQRGRVLSDEQVTTLVSYADAIERLFDTPQDVEWSVADGRLWVLQSRPITTLFPVPSPPPDDDALHVYYSFNHRQGMTESMPPLVADYWRRVTATTLGRVVGYDLPTGPVSTTAGGIVYMDVTPLVRSDRLSARLFASLEEVDRAAIPPLEDVRERRGDELADISLLRGVSPTRTLSTAGRLLPAVGRSILAIVRGLVSRSYEGVPRRSREWADRLAERLIRGVRGGETHRDRIRILLETYEEIAFEGVTQAFKLWNVYVYRAALKRLCPGADEEFEALGRGLRENVTTAMMLELGDVTDVARDRPAVEQALSDGRDLEEIREVEGGEAFVAAFEDFLDEYGFRAPAEIEFSRPRYREDPSPLLETVRASLETGERGDHRRRVDRLEAEAEAAIERLERRAAQAAFGSIRRRLVRPFAARYRSYLSMRETPKYALSQLLDETRHQVLAAGEYLEREGGLDDAADVWLYDFDELLSALASPAEPIDVDLDARRAEHRRNRQLRAPRVIASDGEIPRGAAADTDVDGLVGTPTSDGIAEGVARVVHDPGDAALERGEILVAPHTDPGWTPLFLNAAGLVTDVGGVMTHGSLVAREYGIPSVVAAEATREIDTGDRIRVDGIRGVVEFLEDG